MHLIKVLLVSALLAACGMPGTNEYGNIEASQETVDGAKACVEGTIGGISLCDNLVERTWEMKNLSDTAAHLTCTVRDKGAVIIDQYYLTAQATESVPDQGIEQGDIVECAVWLGYFEGPIHRILQSKPDVTCQFVYARVSAMPASCNESSMARIPLPTVKGVHSIMITAYRQEDSGTISGIEEGTDFVTENKSSDAVDYQVFAVKTTSETKVEIDFELCKVRMYVSTDDVCTPGTAVTQGQILVIAVRAYDASYSSFKSSDYAIVKLDLSAQKAAIISNSALHGGLP